VGSDVDLESAVRLRVIERERRVDSCTGSEARSRQCAANHACLLCNHRVFAAGSDSSNGSLRLLCPRTLLNLLLLPGRCCATLLYQVSAVITTATTRYVQVVMYVMAYTHRVHLPSVD
jgi:hypothetical protein